MKFQPLVAILVALFITGCYTYSFSYGPGTNTTMDKCPDWLCLKTHIEKKGCAPVVYAYEGKTLEIQGDASNATYPGACKVQLNWSDGTQMTCYPIYVEEIQFISNGTPVSRNCTGTYADAYREAYRKAHQNAS